MEKETHVAQSLSVGELSKRAGVAVSAIHFYEAKGLIYSWRTDGQQRRFPRGVLRIIALIKSAQTLGFSLEEIKETLELLPKERAPTQEEWEKLAAHWRRELNNRIKKLTTLRDHLDGCIGCGCLSMRECPLRNTDDKFARKGPGAHLL